MKQVARIGLVGVLSAMDFGATAVLAVGGDALLEELFKKRANRARKIAVDEMKSCVKSPLEIPDMDEFVAIVYRYGRAASEGAATLNLRLMAKVMRGQAVSGSMYASDFLAYADILSTLRREEVVYLATLLRFTKEGTRLSKGSDTDETYGVEQSVAIQLSRTLAGSDFFKDHAALNACILAVQRTGLIRHVTWMGDGSNIYAASVHLEKLGELAQFESALSEEGIYI